MTGNERIRVGDVVVLHNEDKHRGFWKLGLVEKLLTGLDGKPRGAVVRVHQRGNSTTLLRRPVQRLYPIEVGPPNSSNSDSQVESSVGEVPQPQLETDLTPATGLRRSHRSKVQETRDRMLACSY